MKIAYFKPGTWIAVPISGGWVPCLVARKNRSASLMLLYVFQKHDVLPDLVDLQSNNVSNSKSVIQTGMGPSWSIIGVQPGFSNEDWPIPAFVHINPGLTLSNGDVVESRAVLRMYDDKLAGIKSEISIPMDLAGEYPVDVLMGYLAAEYYLSNLVWTEKDD